MKKLLPIFVIIVLLVGGGAFYGGMKYQESKMPKGLAAGNFSTGGGSAFGGQNLRNLSPEEQQQRLEQLGASRSGGRVGTQSGVNSATGEIISKDDKSITVKLRDGGSKIIFYSDTTEVGRFMSGTPSDFEIGKTVTVNGKTNQDGSITAQSIQIRPEIPNQP